MCTFKKLRPSSIGWSGLRYICKFEGGADTCAVDHHWSSLISAWVECWSTFMGCVWVDVWVATKALYLGFCCQLCNDDAVVMLLTFILIIIIIPSPPFIPGLKPSFSANPSRRSLPFLLQDWLHGFPGLFLDTSEHICFLLFSFLFSTFTCWFHAVD